MKVTEAIDRIYAIPAFLELNEKEGRIPTYSETRKYQYVLRVLLKIFHLIEATVENSAATDPEAAYMQLKKDYAAFMSRINKHSGEINMAYGGHKRYEAPFHNHMLMFINIAIRDIGNSSILFNRFAAVIFYLYIKMLKDYPRRVEYPVYYTPDIVLCTEENYRTYDYEKLVGEMKEFVRLQELVLEE